MRKLIIVLVALAVVAGAVYAGSRRLLVPAVAEPTPGTLQSGPGQAAMVRCRGRVVPHRWLALRFAASGPVARIAVQEGSQVNAGDVLAELGAEDLSLELRAAEQRVLSARAQLAQARATPDPERLRVAQAQVAAARARLDALRASPTAAELEQARLRLDQARNALWAAQASRDAVGGSSHSGPAYEQAKASVATAELNVRLAELSYQAVKAGPAPDVVAAAEAQLAQAEAALAELEAGPAREELAILEAALAQAEIALEQVRARGQKAEQERKLIAPFQGVVTSIGIQEGQVAGPSVEAIVLADLSQLEVETVDLSELDVGAVRLEQPVEITIPGYGNPIVQGRVSYISPQATVSPSGQVLYRVVVSLDRQVPGLRWGMSASLQFGKRLK